MLATGGYGNVFFLSTNAKASNATAIWRAHRKGALFANPCFTQIHPTCIPASDEFQSKLTLMSESLRNDGRIWVPKQLRRPPLADQIPEDERDYFLERRYPAFGNLVPRDVALARRSRPMSTQGRGVGPLKNGVYLDFGDAIERLGRDVIEERYGNLFEMYERITGEDPYDVPMRIYPAVHYTMGGLWVDYELQSTIPGCFVAGEANFSDHGANRLGASALMQGLADGYFVLPYTVPQLPRRHARPARRCRSTTRPSRRPRPRCATAPTGSSSIGGTRSVDHFHRELGKIMWDYCGMARVAAEPREGARARSRRCARSSRRTCACSARPTTLNQSLEKAGRVADFFELAELMCRDALHREESCGGHFRVEHQTEDGEALRDDDQLRLRGGVGVDGRPASPVLHKEPLEFEYVQLAQRSYK